MTVEVLLPSSPAEAVQLFGDGAGTTVIGGGTVVIPELTHGRLGPGRVLLLAKAGLGGVSADGATVTIGAAASIESLLDLGVDALAACARNVADVEIRGQGTVGGNLCVGASGEAPRGDLQGACSRSERRYARRAQAARRTEPLEDFLGRPARPARPRRQLRAPGRVGVCRARIPAHARVHGARRQRRPHRVGRDQARRHGVAGPGSRLPSAEAKASDPEAAGAAAVADVSFADDALASAWYREQTLPVLVRRVLTQLQESA